MNTSDHNSRFLFEDIVIKKKSCSIKVIEYDFNIDNDTENFIKNNVTIKNSYLIEPDFNISLSESIDSCFSTQTHDFLKAILIDNNEEYLINYYNKIPFATNIKVLVTRLISIKRDKNSSLSDTGYKQLYIFDDNNNCFKMDEHVFDTVISDFLHHLKNNKPFEINT